MQQVSHAPDGYICGACSFIEGGTQTKNVPTDIVYQNDYAAAIMAYTQWTKLLPHVVVITNKHFENIYAIPEEHIAEVYKVVKRVAAAMRSAYGCDGITIMQNNEPAGGQDVWHFHTHVYPRRNGDGFLEIPDRKQFAEPEVRAQYALKLQQYLAEHAD